MLYKDFVDDIHFPDVVEITFVKKESILSKDIINGKIDYPCPDLDFPNAPFRPDFKKLRFQ